MVPGKQLLPQQTLILTVDDAALYATICVKANLYNISSLLLQAAQQHYTRRTLAYTSLSAAHLCCDARIRLYEARSHQHHLQQQQAASIHDPPKIFNNDDTLACLNAEVSGTVELSTQRQQPSLQHHSSCATQQY
jgi:hypothetical protein